MEKAGDILKLFLDKKQLDAAKSYNSLFRGWENIAGVDIAAHSEVKDVREHTVILEVDHPGWIQMIQMKYRTILRTMQSRYPELNIKKIHLKLAERGKRNHRYTGKREQAEDHKDSGQGPSKKLEPRIETIQDQRLKKALENLEKRIRGS